MITRAIVNVQLRLQAASIPAAAAAASNGRKGPFGVYRTFGSMRHFLVNGQRRARLRQTKLRTVMLMMSVDRRMSRMTAPAVVACMTSVS